VLDFVSTYHGTTVDKIMKSSNRAGFSLIEMVIVSLILGIIAAVAAPKMFDTAKTAEQNSTRQQLAVLRNTLEMYRARDGVYPLTGTLPTALGPMLNGPFPAPSMGTVRGKAGVHYDATTTVDISVVASPGATTGWAYKPSNGSLKLNLAAGETGADW
jgi:general secretion pathway protein G